MKVKLPTAMVRLQKKLAKHSPEILLGFGIAGMLTTTILAVSETPKALELINELKNEEKVEELHPAEVIKAAWKCYIPAAITFAFSASCLVGGSAVNLKRNAALATAYTISEKVIDEYRDYKQSVVETVGANKEMQVSDNLLKKKIDQYPMSKQEIFVTEKGNTLCWDSWSASYFRSDIDTIKRAENEINKQLIADNFVSLNDFYYKIGVPVSESGEKIGWNSKDGLVDVFFSSQLADDGTPCVVIKHNNPPVYDFYN